MLLRNRQVGVIGTGNMGDALINGLLLGQVCKPEQIFCSEVRPEQRRKIRQDYGAKVTSRNIDVAKQTDILILAVKPQVIKPVISEIAECIDLSKLVISIAAGVPLSAIESCAGKELRLIRVMPNICVSVRAGISAIAAGTHAEKEDLAIAKMIFDSVGKSVFIGENLLDAVTGLSGSGPAYVFLIIDALADGGVKAGLARNDALILASQTLFGAAKMLIETGQHPGVLKDMVASPGGTSITGLHAMEDGKLRAALINAVEAATLRSKALGELVKSSLLQGGNAG